jgi:FkbM family methyltransferase
LKVSTLNRLLSLEIEYFNLVKTLEFRDKFKDSGFEDDKLVRATRLISKSMSQLYQDLVCLLLLDFKESGFFVEFGATDGVRFSNTHLLEKEFGWNGILAEPGRSWHGRLNSNRTSMIDTRCVYKTTGDLVEFNETSIGELSTIHEYSFDDRHANARIGGAIYEVETVSLNDLLIQNGAPAFIDYLSIDTEGSEYEILLGVDFQRYKFGFISCEHNYSSKRDSIHKLLTSKGYKRVLSENSLFDDWYVNRSPRN